MEEVPVTIELAFRVRHKQETDHNAHLALTTAVLAGTDRGEVFLQGQNGEVVLGTTKPELFAALRPGSRLRVTIRMEEA